MILNRKLLVGCLSLLFLLLATVPVQAAHFVWDPQPTSLSETYTGYVRIDGELAGTGDEVGIFDGDLLVGAGAVNASGLFTFTFVYAKDGAIPGATIGHTLTFKVWDNSANQEFVASEGDMASEVPFGDFLVTEIPPVFSGDGNDYFLNLSVHNVGIAGTVTNGVGGTVMVGAFTGLWVIPPVAVTNADVNGNYLLSQDEQGTPLANGSYYIFAWRETGGNDTPSYGEFQGVHGAPTAVAFAGADVTDIDIELDDTTGVGPQIASGAIERVSLPGGIGPTLAAGLHGNFDLTMAGGSAVPTQIQVELPGEGGAAISFPQPLSLVDGGYELFRTMTAMPQGTWMFLAVGANNMVDTFDVTLTTLPGAMPAAPVLTAPVDNATVNTALLAFTWTGGTEGVYQEFIIDDEGTFVEPHVLIKENLTTGAYTLQGGEELVEGNSYFWTAGVADASGENIAYAAPFSLGADLTGPVTTATGVPAGNISNVNFNVTLTASETATITYTLDGTDPTTSGTAVTFSAVPGALSVDVPFTTEGTSTLQYFALDTAGNLEATQSRTVTLDKTAPVTTADKADNYLSNVNFDLTLTAPGSTGITYTTDGTDPVTSGTAVTAASPKVLPFTINGTFTIKYFASDSAGNKEATKSLTVTLDKTAPVTTATGVPANNVSKVNFTVTLTANEPAAITYTTDGTDPKTSGTAVTGASPVGVNFATEGTFTLRYFAADPAGNQEANKSLIVTLDKTAPTTTPSPAAGTYGAAQTVTLAATDATSGVLATLYQLYAADPGVSPAAPATPYVGGIALAAPVAPATVKDYWLVYRSQDNAGNNEAIRTAHYTIDTGRPVTNATLTAGNLVAGSWYAPMTATVNLASLGNTIYYEWGVNAAADPTTSSAFFAGGGGIVLPAPAGVETHYVLKFFAVDALRPGLPETVQTLNVYTDLAIPTLVITSPAVGAYLANPSYNIAGTAADGLGLALVEVSINNGNTWNAAVGTGNWTRAATLATGPNTILARATDLAGNVSQAGPVILNYHAPIALSVNGVPVTGGEIYVPNLAGNNVKVIQVTGGTGLYDPALAMDPLVGAITAHANGTPITFTASLGLEGTGILTVADRAAPGVYSASLTIHAVSFGINGPGFIVLGQTQNYQAVGSQGLVEWTAEPVDVAGEITTSGAMKETVTIKPLIDDDFLLTAKDTALSISQSMTVTVVNPLDVTPKGYAVPETFSQQYRATGGSGTYTWTVEPTAIGYLTTKGILVTLDTADPLPRPFTVTAQDAKWPALSAIATGIVVPPITITGPGGGILYMEDGFDFTAAGGSNGFTWVASLGTINANTGHYTPSALIDGQEPVDVVISVYDTTYKNLTSYTRISIYGDVAISGKPSAGSMKVTAGRTTDSFRVTGGLRAFVWTIEGPDGFFDTTTSNVYTFQAPTAGAFAGAYTVTATDGNSSDTFVIYVPISLQAVDNDTNLKPIPANFQPGQTHVIYAKGSDEPLTLTVIQKPFVAGTLVLDNYPEVSPNDNFTVDTENKGHAIIKVREASDTGSKWAGWLRVSVLPPSRVHGIVSNIPASAGAQEITVTLQNPVTGARFEGNPVAGAYDFTGVGWGTYNIALSARVAGIAPYATSSKLVVAQEDVTKNFVLPNLPTVANAHTLTITVAGDYNGYSPYYWRVLNNKGLLITQGMESDATLEVALATGTYRVILGGEGYRPWRSEEFNLAGDKILNAPLVDPSIADPLWPGYHPDRKVVMASHIYRNNGFRLRVVTKNIADADFGMGISTGVGTMNLVHGVDYTGSGTGADPYVFDWDTSLPALTVATDTPRTGDTSYLVQFYFLEGAVQVPYEYQATWVDYGSPGNMQLDKPKDLRDLETETDTRGGLQAIGEVEFYPLDGVVFDLWLPDATGAERRVTITIPSLPVDHLYMDNYDLKGKTRDNLGYAGPLPGQSDFYNIPVFGLYDTYDPITEDDLLRLELSYFSLGPDTVGTGLALDLWRVEDGNRVRYNPILSKTQGRTTDAPIITVPAILNPSAPFFDSFLTLGLSSGRLRVLVSERGDGTAGYHIESLPFLVQEDGLMQVSATHLTSFGVGISTTNSGGGGTGSLDTTTSGASGGDYECFIGSAAPAAPAVPVSGGLPWALGAALLACAAAFARRLFR